MYLQHCTREHTTHSVMFATPQNRNWHSVLCQQLRAVQQITHPAKCAASYTTATNAMCYVCGKVKNTNHLLFYVCITVQYRNSHNFLCLNHRVELQLTNCLMTVATYRTATNTLRYVCSTVINSNKNTVLGVLHGTGQQITEHIMCAAPYKTAYNTLCCVCSTVQHSM